MEAPSPHSDRNHGWLAALALISAIVLIRCVYVVWLNPYELAADEAQYWDWSRRLALSYYTKGPGVAWAIAASTGLFGVHEWSVRLPAIFSHGVAMFAVAGLAGALTGDGRAKLFAAAAFALTPAFWAMGQFMTIDMPFIACWALACWAGWAAMNSTGSPTRRRLTWIALGAALGIGFLFKYTILLLIPGLLVYSLVTRRKPKQKIDWIGPWLAVGVFIVCCLPVIIWNIQHGGATVRHLLGHLHMAGGDVQARKGWSYDPLWTLEMLGTQIGVIGPPMFAMILIGLRRGVTNPDGEANSSRTGSPRRYVLCCGLPVILLYLVVSFITDVEGNWPLPGWVSLIALAGAASPALWDAYRQRVQQWLAMEPPRIRAGWMRAKPETGWQLAWHWSMGWGIVAALLISFGGYARFVPYLNDLPGVERIAGHRERADDVQSVIDELARRTGARPAVVSDNYRKTAWLAFYLPRRPVVYCASRWMGGRVSQYDHFTETNLAGSVVQTTLHGRPMVMVDGNAERWPNAMQMQGFVAVDRVESVFTADRFDTMAPLPTRQR